MSTANNPAGRLHEILRAMLGQNKNPQQSAYDGFRQILCPTELRADVVVPRIVRVLELPSIVKLKIEAIPDILQGQYISWIPPVQQHFNTRNFDQNFDYFVAKVDTNMLSLVAFCDQLLSSHAPEPTVAQATIDRMRAYLEVFAREVRDAELDEHLREYLLHYIDLIDRALIDYRIMGFEAINEGIVQAGGMLATQKASADRVMGTQFSSKFVVAFLGLASVCSGYPGAKLMISDMSLLLPAFAEQAEVELKDPKLLPGVIDVEGAQANDTVAALPEGCTDDGSDH